jgi:cytoskeleton protein RodZ
MGSFGERMQREREMRGITLEEISEHTKISTRNLRALEEENFGNLPGGIFNKGFVRAYAHYLGIDTEQAVTDLLAAENEALRKKMDLQLVAANRVADGQIPKETVTRLESVPSIHAVADPAKAPVEGDQAAGFMKAAVVLVVLLGAGGFAYRFMQARSATDPVQVPIAKSATSTGDQDAITSAPPAKPSEDVQQASIPAMEPHTGSLLDQHSVPAMITTVQAAAPAAMADAGKVSLQIRTREESWVQVKADGKLLMEGMLTASSSKSFAADKELVVKLGNAAGVELSYNGKTLPAFDSDRRTRTLTFTPEGIQQ